MLNSAVVSFSVTILRVLFCAMGGYAFARLNFPLENVIFTAMLISMMIPGQVTLIPNFLIVGQGLVRRLGSRRSHDPHWLRSLEQLGRGNLAQHRRCVWHFHDDPVLQEHPKKYGRRAMIDGSGRFGIFFRVTFAAQDKTQFLTWPC